jgi:hypothetical protein
MNLDPFSLRQVVTAPQHLEANYDRPEYLNLEAINESQIIYNQILKANYYLKGKLHDGH